MNKQPFDGSFGKNPSENYERFFVPAIGRPMAVDLVGAAGLEPGDRVLDVACGTGIVARLALEKVGPRGKVAGLDANAGMLAVARKAAPPDSPIEWHEGDAQDMPLPDGSFDHALCQLSLQFMNDKIGALGEMHRVLADGGRAGLNVPGPAGPVFSELDEILGRHLGPGAAGFVATVFSLHDVDSIRSLMEEAGFSDVSVRAGIKPLRLPPPREFLWQYVYGTPLAAMASEADPGTLESLEREVVSNWKALEDAEGMVSEQPFAEARGRK